MIGDFRIVCCRPTRQGTARMEAGHAKNSGGQLQLNESTPLQQSSSATKCAPVSI